MQTVLGLKEQDAKYLDAAKCTGIWALNTLQHQQAERPAHNNVLRGLHSPKATN
jgi:hypothetical protein